VPAVEAAGHTSDVDVEQELLDRAAGGDCLPDVPLPDITLPDFPVPEVPHPNVHLANDTLPVVHPGGSVREE